MTITNGPDRIESPAFFQPETALILISSVPSRFFPRLFLWNRPFTAFTAFKPPL